MNKCLTTLLSLFAFTAFAETKTDQSIRDVLKTLLPDVEVESVQATPIPGIYEIASGTNIIYMTDDGKYIIQGDIYAVENNAINNLTDEQRGKAVKKIMDETDPATLIIYPAEQEKTYITVITDVDCTYCRAFHKEVPELNAAGITVRYMAFPRTPPGTASYEKMISIWCNPNRSWALTDAKTGGTPTKLNCKHPVDEHVALVHQMGFNGTPTIIFKNGRIFPGYTPAKQLIEMVEKYG